jgi:archaellum component FlaC
VSSSFFSLRDDTIRMEQRVAVVERDLRRVDSVPAAMATMSADIITIKEQLSELREDVKRLATNKR